MPLLPSLAPSTPPSRTSQTPPATRTRKSQRIASATVRRASRVPGWTASFGNIQRSPPPAVVYHPDDSTSYDAAIEVFDTPELLRLILLLCDWHTIMTVSRTCQYGRHSAQLAVRALTEEVLNPFIQRDEFLDFLDMMDTTGSGVAGSIARRLLYSNSGLHLQALVDGDTRFLSSNDLNILVPKGHIDAVKAFFVDRGVPSFTQHATQLPYTSTVRAFYRGTRPSVGDRPSVKITLTHCEDDIFQAVVASPFSAQANLITSTRVYSVYPHLATSRHALRTNWQHVRGVVRSLPCTFHSRNDNEMWKENGGCQQFCPSMHRISVGDRITASFLWNARYAIPVSRFPHTDSLMASSVVSWRISSRCHNVKCKRYQPDGQFD